jgi:hypothetical protein
VPNRLRPPPHGRAWRSGMAPAPVPDLASSHLTARSPAHRTGTHVSPIVNRGYAFAGVQEIFPALRFRVRLSGNSPCHLISYDQMCPSSLNPRDQARFRCSRQAFTSQSASRTSSLAVTSST